MAVVWIYTGDGYTFYNGVPMRDILADEWAALSPEQQVLVASGAIYTPA